MRFRKYQFSFRQVKTRKYIAAFMLFGCLALAVIGIGVWGIHTEFVKRRLSAQLSDYLSGLCGYQVSIGRISGRLPYHVYISQCALGDEQGVWLILNGLSLDWRWQDLVKGSLDFQQIAVDSAILNRIPQTIKAGKTTGAFRKQLPVSCKFDDWPLPDITIDRMSIARIAIQDSHLPQGWQMGITGQALSSKSTGQIQGTLNCLRTDAGPKTELNVNFKADLMAQTINLDVRFEEDDHGGVAAAIDCKDLGALMCHFHANGPLNRLAAKIHVDAAQVAGADLDIQLDLSDRKTIHTTGTVYPNRHYLPLSVRTFFKDAFALQSQWRFTANELILEDALLTAPGKRVALVGRFLTDQNRIESHFNIQFDSLPSKLAQHTDAVRYKMALSGGVNGPLDALKGKLDVQLDEIATDDFDLRDFKAQIRIAKDNFAKDSFQVNVEGGVEQIIWQGHPLITAGQSETAIQAELRIRPTGDLWLHHVWLTNQQGVLKLAGKLRPQFRAADLSGQLHLHHWPISAEAQTLDGDCKGNGLADIMMETRISTSDWRKTIDAEVTGRGCIDSSLPAFFNHFAGQPLDFTSRIKVEDWERIHFYETVLGTADLQITADTVFNLKNRYLQSSVRGTISSIRQLAGYTGKMPFYTAICDATIKGPLGELKGSLNASIQTERQSLNLTTITAFANHILTLSDIHMQNGANQLGGTLAINFDRQCMQGKLSGELNRLEDVGRFLEVPLEGSALIDCRFDAKNEKQLIELKLSGGNVAAAGFKARSLALSMAVQDALSHPAGHFDFSVDELETGHLRFSRILLQLHGNQQQFEFSTYAQSSVLAHSEIVVRGTGSFVKSQKYMRFQEIEGKLGSLNLHLIKPAQIDLNQGVLFANTLQIACGKGQITTNGKIAGHTNDLTINCDNLNLNFIKELGGPEIRGMLNGRMQFNGTPLNPIMHANISGTGIVFMDHNLKELPPSDLKIGVDLKDGRLETEVGLYGLYDRPCSVRIALPVNLSFFPYASVINRQKPITGSLDATFEMEMISSLIFGQDQIAAGKVTASVSLSGSINNPLIEGALKIENGQYEYLEYGTLLRHVHIEAVVDHSKLRLIDAHATDGAKGQIDISGWMTFNPDEGYPIELQARLENLSVVRQDDFTCPGSGTLKLSGPWYRLLLEGDLVTGPVEFILEESAVASLAELQIIEINKNSKRFPASGAKGIDFEPLTGQPAATMLLDLNIDLPSQVFIRGWGIDSEWRGQLRIGGTTDDPVIFGSLNAIRGSYRLISKPFKMTYGLISFSGASPPTPLLDITTEAENENLKAILAISGNADLPVIILSSTPSMPTDEIVSQLFFKENTANINPTQAIQLAAALQTLSGNRNRNLDVMSQTRKLLQLDQLELRKSQEELKNTTIGFGKYLIPGVYLDVEESLGGELGKVTVEMEVTPNISVEGETGPKSQNGVGLNYKYDY